VKLVTDTGRVLAAAPGTWPSRGRLWPRGRTPSPWSRPSGPGRRSAPGAHAWPGDDDRTRSVIDAVFGADADRVRIRGARRVLSGCI